MKNNNSGSGTVLVLALLLVAFVYLLSTGAISLQPPTSSGTQSDDDIRDSVIIEVHQDQNVEVEQPVVPPTATPLPTYTPYPTPIPTLTPTRFAICYGPADTWEDGCIIPTPGSPAQNTHNQLLNCVDGYCQ